MTQTRTGSAVETATNLVVGQLINFTANMTVLPLFGLHPTPADAVGMGLIFTVISVARSYTLRRVFNRIRRFHA
jgi:hypothetical protein